MNLGLKVLEDISDGSSANDYNKIALGKKLKADLLYESTFLKNADVKKLSISSLELFNDLEPDNQANLFNQGVCYLRKGDVNLAIQLLLKSAGEGYSQKFSTGVWNALGVAYREK